MADTRRRLTYHHISTYQSLAGLLCGNALLTIGNGLLQTLIPLRILDAGASTLVVGLIQSCYYCGFLLGAVFNRRLIDRVGQHRTFVGLCAGVVILALAFGMFQSPLSLAAIRLLTGFAFMGIATSMESWLNGSVENTKRGQVYGFYTTINCLAMAAGQFLLNVGDFSGAQHFSIVAGLFAAAVLPVSLLEGWPEKATDKAMENLPAQKWMESLRAMTLLTPLAIPGCILTGCLYSTFYSVTPVLLVRTGFTTAAISTFMGLALISALIPQWPLGRLSDRIDRRSLVYRTALISLFLSVLLVGFHERTVVWTAMLAYVAVISTQYGLIVSYVNDRVEPHLRVVISINLLVMYSLGGMIGPAIASALMTIIGPCGLFVFNGVSCALLATRARKALAASPRV